MSLPFRRTAWRTRLLGLAAVLASLAVSGTAKVAAESTGTVTQPLVVANGAAIDTATQESFGLLSLTSSSGSCSAALLRNSWAITAAHCIEQTGPTGAPLPDPRRPGQNVTVMPSSVRLQAAWSGGQQQTAIQIETYRPYDIAIIRVGAPFTVRGTTNAFNQGVFHDGQFPYFGQEVPVTVTMFGRGISAFARQTPAGPQKATRDGLYRMGQATTTRAADYRVWSSSATGSYVAGGDSGGPSFAWVYGGYVLFGVHSASSTVCLAGMACGAWPGPGPAPAGYNPWDWVAAAPESGDAPVQAVWSQISATMGAFIPPPDPANPQLPPAGYDGSFGPSPNRPLPPQPTGLRLKDKSLNQIELAWTPNFTELPDTLEFDIYSDAGGGSGGEFGSAFARVATQLAYPTVENHYFDIRRTNTTRYKVCAVVRRGTPAQAQSCSAELSVLGAVKNATLPGPRLTPR